MTAAQVVITRAPSAPPRATKDDGPPRVRRGQNNGFEDALGRADAAGAEVSCGFVRCSR